MRICLFLPLVFALCVLASAAPAVAQSSDEQTAEELAREGIHSLLRALDAFVDMIPQYETPELTDEGDIIIRRKRKPESAPSSDPEIDETRT